MREREGTFGQWGGRKISKRRTREKESREWEVAGTKKENLFERKWFVNDSTVECTE